ncbi:MAG: hypothetical protein ACOY93_00345 [Bacillota bacterium]
MLVDIIIGVVYGAAVGHLGNLLLFRKMENNRLEGKETLRGIGGVFFLRYGLDGLGLVILYLLMKSPSALVAAALSITVAVKISLFMVYMRKGGRFD